LASSLIGKSKLDTDGVPAVDAEWEGEDASGRGGNSRGGEGKDSGSVLARGRISSFVKGGGEGAFSGRELGWGRHAEDRKRIIPTTTVLYVMNRSS